MKLSRRTLSAKEEQLVQVASALLWPIERAQFKKRLTELLESESKYVRSFSDGEFEVVTYALASLIWLRFSSVFALAALGVWIFGEGSQNSMTFKVALSILCIMAVVPFTFCLQRLSVSYRRKTNLKSRR